MGSLERRVRALEEHDRREGYAAALQMLSDEDWAVLGPYIERWHSAGGERVPQPYPTPREAEVLAELNRLRRRAIREGWGSAAWRPC